MVTSTIERIRAHLKCPGVTKKGLAEKAGLHPNTLQGVESASWNPTAATLVALEAHLPPVEGEARADGDEQPTKVAA